MLSAKPSLTAPTGGVQRDHECQTHNSHGESARTLDRYPGRVIRFALVGCGRIAQRHAALLGTGQIEGAQLVAVCDVVASKAGAIAAKYGVPAYEDFMKMARDVPIDVFVVLTESGYHARHVCELAQFGRPVIVEKPMALTLADADSMIEATMSKGVPLFVVKQNRFNLPIVRLREALVAGRFGRLVLGTVRVRWCREQPYYDQAPWRGTWHLDGGVLANQASHHIDMLRWMLGDVESVSAMATTALVDIEAEDTAVATVRFTSGALGAIEATTATRPTDLEGSISILGEDGTVVVEGFALNKLSTWSFRDQWESDADVISQSSTNPPDVYGFGHLQFYESVVRALQGNGGMQVDGEDGRRSLELIIALYQSIETGSMVHLNSPPSHSRLGIYDGG